MSSSAATANKVYSKHHHQGGFHLHLFVFPFVYQFILIIEALVRSSFRLTTVITLFISTLKSGIDVGQLINVGPGKCGKKNKRSM